MKTVNLTVSKDPFLFGNLTSTQQVDSFAYNLAKQIEKIFSVKVQYDTFYCGNSYRLECVDDPYIEMEISQYLDSSF